MGASLFLCLLLWRSAWRILLCLDPGFHKKGQYLIVEGERELWMQPETGLVWQKVTGLLFFGCFETMQLLNKDSFPFYQISDSEVCMWGSRQQAAGLSSHSVTVTVEEERSVMGENIPTYKTQEMNTVPHVVLKDWKGNKK